MGVTFHRFEQFVMAADCANPIILSTGWGNGSGGCCYVTVGVDRAMGEAVSHGAPVP